MLVPARWSEPALRARLHLDSLSQVDEFPFDGEQTLLFYIGTKVFEIDPCTFIYIEAGNLVTQAQRGCA